MIYKIKLYFVYTFVLILFTSCASVNKELKFDAMLRGYNYPFQTHSFKFKSQNQTLTMNYMDIKPVTDKPIKGTVVLFHGKNFAGYYWKDIAIDLQKDGYRVIMPDQIGFGKSTKPKSYQYSFYQMALNTQKLLKSIGVHSFTLVGHSMGGMLATHFTYLYPKYVSKLILINPIGLEPYLKYVEYKDTNFFFSKEKNKTESGMRNYQKKNYYDGNWNKEYEKLLIPHIGQMNGSEWELIAWNNALTYSPIFAEDITSKLKDIKTRTVLIIGTRDKTGPGRAWKKEGVQKKLGLYNNLGKSTDAQLPNSVLYELQNLGHMPQVEDYETFSKYFHKAMND